MCDKKLLKSSVDSREHVIRWMEKVQDSWESSTSQRSGNLTTHDFLPGNIRNKLLSGSRDFYYLTFEQQDFTRINSELPYGNAMSILAGLQSIKKEDNLTSYRAVRFPTATRMSRVITRDGLSIPNYEQERIRCLYSDKDYRKRRADAQDDKICRIQPQERIVEGIPVFSLVNDAIQIHEAYRSIDDAVMITGIHIPYELLRTDKIELYTNAPIDADYWVDKRDVKVSHFKKHKGSYVIDYSALRAKGVDCYEMYLKNMPWNICEHRKLGIEQKFYLLKIMKFDDEGLRMLEGIRMSILKKYEYFLHGFFGDQNIFGRQQSKYFPYECYEVKERIFSI